MLLLLATTALAATLTVDPADSTAYATIQSAVTAASSGDTIEIAAGTYTECVDTGGKDLDLTGTSGSRATTLTGGSSCTSTPTLTVDNGETGS